MIFNPKYFSLRFSSASKSLKYPKHIGISTYLAKMIEIIWGNLLLALATPNFWILVKAKAVPIIAMISNYIKIVCTISKLLTRPLNINFHEWASPALIMIQPYALIMK